MEYISFHSLFVSLLAANVASLAALVGLALHRSFVLTRLHKLQSENIELRRRMSALEKPVVVRLRT